MGYQIRDKVVAITGASSGIGSAAARAFARQGARLAIGARSEAPLQELAEELRREGTEVFVDTLDVTDELKVGQFFEKLMTQWGYCDVLVNNAGVGLFAPVAELSVGLLHQAMEVNLYGALRCIRSVVPIMRARGRGQIINVSSALGKRSLPYFGGYSATKFALGALTESLRVELADEGIDVILVCPGLTETGFAANTLSSRHDVPDPPVKGQSAEKVAAAIVDASRRRSREVVLTASSKAMLSLNAVSPQLLDSALGQWARRTIQK